MNATKLRREVKAACEHIRESMQTPDYLKPDNPYQFPDATWPGCDEVKRLAAKVARAKCAEDERKAEAKLTDALNDLPTDALRRWAEVVMIDSRFCGATGQGGYWAKASEAVNRIALGILNRRTSMEPIKLKDEFEKARGKKRPIVEAKLKAALNQLPNEALYAWEVQTPPIYEDAREGIEDAASGTPMALKRCRRRSFHDAASRFAYQILKEREREADEAKGPIRQLVKPASIDIDRMAEDVRQDIKDGYNPIILNGTATQCSETMAGLKARGFTVEVIGRELDGANTLQVTACEDAETTPEPESEAGGKIDKVFAFEKALRSQGIDVERTQCLADGTLIARVKGNTCVTIEAGE